MEGIRTKITTRVKSVFFYGNKERKTHIVENRVTGELKNIYSFQTPSNEAICTMHVFVGYSSLWSDTTVASLRHPRSILDFSEQLNDTCTQGNFFAVPRVSQNYR